MVELARKHFAYKEYWLKPSSDESPSLVVATTGPRTVIREPEYIHLAAEVIQHNPHYLFQTVRSKNFSMAEILSKRKRIPPTRILSPVEMSDYFSWLWMITPLLTNQFSMWIRIFDSMPNRANSNTFLKIHPNCHERRRQIPDLDRFIAVRATRCLAGSPQKHSPPS